MVCGADFYLYKGWHGMVFDLSGKGKVFPLYRSEWCMITTYLPKAMSEEIAALHIYQYEFK